jgi:hypothetical protein
MTHEERRIDEQRIDELREALVGHAERGERVAAVTKKDGRLLVAVGYVIGVTVHGIALVETGGEVVPLPLRSIERVRVVPARDLRCSSCRDRAAVVEREGDQ